MDKTEEDRPYVFLLEHILDLQKYVLMMEAQIKTLLAIEKGKETRKP